MYQNIHASTTQELLRLPIWESTNWIKFSKHNYKFYYTVNQKIEILFMGEIFNIKKSHLISNYQISNITKRIWKVLSGENIYFCWSFQKKKISIFDESECISLVWENKVRFLETHQYLHKKWKYQKTKHTMKKFMISALQRYHIFN